MMYKEIQKNKGFTLMELMITVAIIGIISAIAMPSYSRYVQKTKRADAKVEIMRIAQMQESYFVQNMSYAKDLLSSSTDGNLGFAGTAVKSEQEEYEITLTSNPNATCDGTSANPCTSFTLTAKPLSASQLHDTQCIRFTLTNTGQRGVKTGPDSSPVPGTAADVKKCWK